MAALTYTYESSTSARDRLRRLVGDTEVFPISAAVFSDNELDAILSDNGSDVYRAAAEACRAIIMSRAKLGRVVSVGGYSREQALAEYKAMAETYDTKSDATITADSAEMIEVGYTPEAEAQRLVNEALREAL